MKTQDAKNRRRELSWKPKRRGLVYCAPACGGQCTRAAYDNAHTQAKELATRLGKGWKVRVWENLGWHWEVFKGELTCTDVRRPPSRVARSYVFLNPTLSVGGMQNFHAFGPTPRKAILEALNQARERRDNLDVTIAMAEQILEELDD